MPKEKQNRLAYACIVVLSAYCRQSSGIVPVDRLRCPKISRPALKHACIYVDLEMRVRRDSDPRHFNPE